MLHGMSGIYIPGNSAIHRMHPISKLTGFLLLIACIVAAGSVAEYLIVFVLVTYLVLACGINPAATAGASLRLWPFWLVVFLMNTLFYESDDPYFQWAFITISAEGATHGINVVFKIVFVMISANVLTATTPPMEIMNAFKSMIRPLALIGVNTENTALILSAAMQFIPVMLEESDMIRKAQIARGARFESDKLHERALSMLPMVVPIFLAAFKRADELALAIEARGYRTDGKRTASASSGLKAKDLPGIIIPLIVFIAELTLI